MWSSVKACSPAISNHLPLLTDRFNKILQILPQGIIS